MGQKLRVLRRPLVNWYGATTFAVFFAMSASFLYSSVMGGIHVGSVVPAVLAGTTGTLVVRSARSGVVVREHGLVVHNLVTTFEIPWSAIEKVSSAGQGMFDEGIPVYLRNGRRIRCTCIGAGRGEVPSKVDHFARELEEFLRAAHANGDFLSAGQVELARASALTRHPKR